METVFTPWQSLGGGVLIGVAAVLLMLFLGRIMGATGILSGALIPAGPREAGWRRATIAGMISGPLVVALLTGRMPAVEVPTTPLMLIVGGLIVGVGVTYASGCTSGHGICGNARLSPRSMVATVTFMLATIVTVYIVRHVLGA